MILATTVQYIFEKGSGDNAQISFDGFSQGGHRRMSSRWYDCHKITGIKFSLPLGFSTLVNKSADQITSALEQIFTDLQAISNSLGNTSTCPLLAQVTACCTDDGINEVVSWKKLAKIIMELRDKHKDDYNLVEIDELLHLICQEHALASNFQLHFFFEVFIISFPSPHKISKNKRHSGACTVDSASDKSKFIVQFLIRDKDFSFSAFFQNWVFLDIP